MESHIIYIPGLGDRYDGFRRVSLKLWKIWGVSTELVPMTWYDGRDFIEKYTRVDQAIARATANGKKVFIIGESAGATMALHAATRNRVITRTVTLCGVSRRETPIADYIRRKAPALHEAVNTLPNHHNEADIVSIRAALDSVVAPRYSTAPSSRSHVVWSAGHFVTIVLCLTILAPHIITVTTRQSGNG